MERLYTPWRRAFIEGVSSATTPDTGCFMCDLAQADPADDRRHLVLVRGPRTLTLLNLYPYNNGHTLIAPYRHTGDYVGLDEATLLELSLATQRVVAALGAEYHPHAFNTGMNLGREAGAGLPDHLHVHVVPRWNGDTNFMPLFSETRVLPETLEQTYARLQPRLAALWPPAA